MNDTVANRKKRLAPALGAGVLILIGLYVAAYVWAQSYQDRISPNVFVAEMTVGGMDPEAAQTIIQKKIDDILLSGITVETADESATLPLSTLSSSDVIEDARFYLESAMALAARTHHHPNRALDVFTLLKGRLFPTHIEVPVTLNRENLEARLLTLFAHPPTPPKNPSFSFEKISDGWDVSFVPGQTGYAYGIEQFMLDLHARLRNLDTRAVVMTLTVKEPDFEISDVAGAVPLAQVALQNAPWRLVDKNKETVVRSWPLTGADIQQLLIPDPSQGGTIAFDVTAAETFIKKIATDVDREAQNAKFSFVDGGRVNFSTSKPGRRLDRATTLAAIKNAWLQSGPTDIAIIAETIEPSIGLGDVNEIGITEPLGVGVSTYRGSPPNRIKNIRNGVRLLNGIVIPNGETFSLLKALAPFTPENGYLPELVIKGDEIIPELGGGLCQIGTTTFRATMNSGLPIVQRRNHSIVVSYYNDPANGNPGTDATIYEPTPDYQFLNDTGNPILFQAEMLEDVGELRFTFWGTSDGRKGSYSAPVVSEWIGVGEPVRIETTKLAVGEETCQSAHVGANASFTYTVVMPDGTKNERVFESHYRPLPKICLVGVEQVQSGNKVYSDRPDGLE